MTNKTYFTKLEALEEIKEMLAYGYDGYYCDLHVEIFNTNYYVSSDEEAEEMLKQYGIFEAIGKVASYENENFDKVMTNISSPSDVANMLWYLIGEETLQKTYQKLDQIGGKSDDLCNSEATQEVNEKLLKFLNIEIEEEQAK